MNGYQRVAAALQGQESDTIPIMLHNFMMAAREYGVTMAEFRSDAKTIAAAFIASVEKYRFDGVIVDIDTVTLAGAVGVPVDFPEDAPARSHVGGLADLSQVGGLGTPRVENYRFVQNWLEAVRLLKEHFGDEVFVRGNCDQAPFTLASLVRGAQDWMIDLMTAEKGPITELLEYCAEATSQFIRLMIQTGCHMVSNGDSTAGPELISPQMYEMYALPYEKRMVAISQSAGLPYALHICGNTGAILERMLQTRADAFELDYRTDTNRVFEVFHDKATLIGNIDPSGVLALGSADFVERKTTELLAAYSGSNRFILNCGCAIPPDTPPENLQAMIRAARQFRAGPGV
jgi:uroporphyrinogen decarboxylase